MRLLLLALSLSFISNNIDAQALQGKLLGTWSDSTLVGSNQYNNTYNEIWGVVANGVEYAVLGSTKGTHFLDVTDPSVSVEVVVIDGGTTGGQIVHRDYHDHQGFLYAVADEGSQSTLQIMDLSFLPDSVPVIYDSKQYIRRSHNIFIDTSSSILYSCISDGDIVSYTPLRLFDISDPYNISVIEDYSRIGGFSMSQVHDAYVQNDTAYLNCGPSGFLIADFTDPLAPDLLSSLAPDEYPQAGYNHSGWLSEDSKTYFMADENYGMDIKVMDVSALPEIAIIDTIDAESPNALSIPHNQLVHGRYLYSSYYYDGLQVWDIADVTNITRVMHYPTSSITHRRDYEGAWGVYPYLPSGVILVSDMQEGLFIIDAVDNLSSNAQPDPIKDDWSISPNPSRGYFEISLNETSQNYQMALLDTNGKKLADLGFKNNLNLAPGQYFVQLSKANALSTKKLIVIE